MNHIIIIGGNGQLGQCLQAVTSRNEQPYHYTYLSSAELNIADGVQTKAIFEQLQPSYCINCAAYTAVDKAEDEQDEAFEINSAAVKRLAEICATYNTTLVHISTDFVFDGSSSKPLTETDPCNPINVYGKSKLQGEQDIALVLQKYYIIRTSWLYSENANNFCKTMIKLAQSKTQLQVIYDQVGTPTYAMDLAKCIVHIINSAKPAYGIYHYSNEGVASWYDFAKAVFEFSEIEMEVIPVNSEAFVTKAIRPHYSVLNKAKIKEVFGIHIPYWRDSLNQCVNNI